MELISFYNSLADVMQARAYNLPFILNDIAVQHTKQAETWTMRMTCNDDVTLISVFFHSLRLACARPKMLAA